MCQLNSKGKHMGDFIITGKVDVLFVQMVIIFKYSNNLLFRVMDHKMF